MKREKTIKNIIEINKNKHYSCENWKNWKKYKISLSFHTQHLVKIKKVKIENVTNFLKSSLTQINVTNLKSSLTQMIEQALT